MEKIYLSKSKKPDKKFMVKVGNKTIHFGSAGMSDYTIHKDPERKERYTKRHQKREKWGIDGIKTAGFWAKALLWNESSLRKSIVDTAKKFNLKIIYK